MPRNYQKRGIRCSYDPARMSEAAAAVRRGIPLRLAAQQYEVPFGTLCKHYKEETVKLGGGRKPELSNDDETTLAEYLRVCALHGEGLTKNETLVLVKDYVLSEQVQTRWGKNGPGEEWLRGFMKRFPELRIRKGEAMSCQRVRGADPFIIKKFYEDVGKMYRTEKIGPEDGNLIFNCDESSFSHDPRDVRVISQKGIKRVSRNIPGSGKSNTTVLACGAADGTKLPPFIIFTGKQLWSTWIPKNDYLGTGYASQANGWMTEELFVKWFKEVFLLNTIPKDQRQKKIILFFDGVRFHVSMNLVKLAQENRVVLVKFPPNVSHFIQPLDKTVFKTMKTDWNKLLIDYVRANPGKVIPKLDFSKHIKTLWEESFKSRNLKSGFESTGLFPLNFEKFPVNAYDPIKYEKFKNKSVKSSTKENNLPKTPNVPAQEPVAGTSRMFTAAKEAAVLDSQSSEQILGSDGPDSPTETDSDSEIPKSQQLEGSRHSTHPGLNRKDQSTSTTSFELFIRKKLSETVKEVARHAAPAGQRKRVSQGEGEILTSQSVWKRLKIQEDEKKKKGAAKEEKKKQKDIKQKGKAIIKLEKKQLKKREKNWEDDETSEEELDPKLLGDEEDDDLDFDFSSCQDQDEEDTGEIQPILPERYYAIYYDVGWYVGRVIKVQEDTCIIKFLKESLDTFNWPSHDDIQTVQEDFILCGPLSLNGNGPFTLSRADMVRIKTLYAEKKKTLQSRST